MFSLPPSLPYSHSSVCLLPRSSSFAPSMHCLSLLHSVCPPELFSPVSFPSSPTRPVLFVCRGHVRSPAQGSKGELSSSHSAETCWLLLVRFTCFGNQIRAAFKISELTPKLITHQSFSQYFPPSLPSY